MKDIKISEKEHLYNIFEKLLYKYSALEIETQIENCFYFREIRKYKEKQIENFKFSGDFDEYFEVYMESRLCFVNELYRSCVFNLISIIEFLLKKKYAEFIIQEEKEKRKVTLDKLIEKSHNDKLIEFKHYSFLKGINNTRNDGIHKLRKIIESDAIVGFEILNNLSKIL